jgi:hypothetical protein
MISCRQKRGATWEGGKEKFEIENWRLEIEKDPKRKGETPVPSARPLFNIHYTISIIQWDFPWTLLCLGM